MLYWLLVFGAFLVVLGLTQWLLAWLKQHGVHINRWIFGLAAFLVVMIPHVVIKHVPIPVDAILYILCAVFAIAFMTESHTVLLHYEKEHPNTPAK